MLDLKGIYCVRPYFTHTHETHHPLILKWNIIGPWLFTPSLHIYRRSCLCGSEAAILKFLFTDLYI